METRERLVESTQELLWERGYVGTSPKAILGHAGVGQGSMYHHFAGKQDLALVAVQRSAQQLTAVAEEHLARPGTALERISGFLDRERDVLRGCPIGRLTADPDIIASAALRQPVHETLGWLQGRLAEVLADGQANGELSADLVPEDTAATIVAVLQGGYVLARGAGSAEPFRQAVDGVLVLLASAATTH